LEWTPESKYNTQTRRSNSGGSVYYKQILVKFAAAAANKIKIVFPGAGENASQPANVEMAVAVADI